MGLNPFLLSIFASSAFGGRLARLMEEPSEVQAGTDPTDMTGGGVSEAPEFTAEFEAGIRPGVQPPTNVGFCSTDPCSANTGTDCCCWSNAAMIAHPSFPNPDQVSTEQHCDTPPDMTAVDLIMMKDPGFMGGTGRFQALEAVAPIYDDRALCCAFSIDDPLVLSLQSPTVEPTTTTTWMAEPTLPPPPRSTPDPLLLQDTVAASMEKAAGDYMEAASAIHATASSLEGALASVKAEADVNFKKKIFTKKLRGIIQHYVSESNKAVEALHGAIAL